jgi:anaerobic magnesium-protoporphyrin IX monomethyl ester cyclase
MKILYLPNEYSQQRQKEKKSNIYPVLMAMEATKRRNNGENVFWGIKNKSKTNEFEKIITEPEGIDFLSLPKPDRNFTQAKSYTSGNYKYLPGTHILSAHGCWHGKCTFCVEQKNKYIVRKIQEVIEEIKDCRNLGFKEIFDDSATFPIGKWLEDFCNTSIEEKFPKDLHFGCNMRIDADVDFKLMKRAGFRMLLFGIESANQKTLDRIQKGVKVEQIIPTIKQAKEAGLTPHVAFMFGYPWEEDKDSKATLELIHFLLRTGLCETAQASFFNCKGEQSKEEARKYIKKIYDVCYSPEFWYNTIKRIRNVNELQFLWKKIKTGIKER